VSDGDSHTLDDCISSVSLPGLTVLPVCIPIRVAGAVAAISNTVLEDSTEQTIPFFPHKVEIHLLFLVLNRLCDLVVRVPGYRSRSSEFDSRR
jgi:hypothetical protein